MISKIKEVKATTLVKTIIQVKSDVNATIQIIYWAKKFETVQILGVEMFTGESNVRPFIYQ
jgi:hypothetical protein